MTVLGKVEGKKKRWWSGIFSCFGDSNVLDSDGKRMVLDPKPVRKRSWSTSARKRRTVPIETVGDARDCETKRHISDGKKEIVCKDQSKPDACPDQNKKQKQQKSGSSKKTTNEDSKVSVQHMSSRCELLSNSALLQRKLDAVQNQTQLSTSNYNSPESSHTSMPESSTKKVEQDRRSASEIESSKLLPIITVAILVVLLFGRGFAVLCMCVYFYVVSRFKSELQENKDLMEKGNDEIDLDSELHKKMVVLRGFLERGKKRPATSLGPSSS